jgi:hypothetical protein
VKLLLDECIDRRLAKEIQGHEVVTVPQSGWAGIKNGELLKLQRMVLLAPKGQVSRVGEEL